MKDMTHESTCPAVATLPSQWCEFKFSKDGKKLYKIIFLLTYSKSLAEKQE